MKEIPKAYDPKAVEDGIYQNWEESGYFNPDNLKLPKNADYFSISMPPPNVTGVLHLGHALENAIMDTAIRFQRLLGKRAVIIPGTDHAAVATQARVEKNLIKEGIKDPRQQLGREKLLEKIREYSENSKATILKQIKKMGTSCDWSRLAYTFDEPRSNAVNKVFIKMYNDGLIYRGYRVVNWSVKGQSTCSDDELVYVERQAKLYTFKYSKDFPFAIATTRPETKLGDTAVAVNPKDKKYKKFIGQTFSVDLGHGQQEIKVVAEDSVDPKFGTGALGVTPAHSMIDFEIAQKNNLPVIKVIGEDGKMTKEAGKDYVGLTVEAAREKFVAWLKDNDLFIGEEDIKQNVGTSDRFGDVIEVIPMTQWWVNVNKEIPGRGKTLKDLMREAVTTGHDGDENQIIKITPNHFLNLYLQWIDNLRDWCISRQIWWGHRIPVWYKNKGKDNEEVFAGLEAPRGNWEQDPDTLDTWFSSGLWTFSTLGWPENIDDKGNKTGDLKKFHPTTWMQMGYELLFFWMARMILMTTYILNEIPFKSVYIHGILRDKDGKKFSKSLGNGIDPIEISKQYGTDALRLSLISGMSAGNDARFYEEKVEGARNFVNKLWNISRYILSSVSEITLIDEKPKAQTIADEWILAKLDNVIAEATTDLKSFNFSSAADTLREFTRSDFADWYLEISKLQAQSSKLKENTDRILLYVLGKLLILWHPFIPFVTEEIWTNFGCKELLLVQKWSEVVDLDIEQKEENDKNIFYPFWKFEEVVMTIRNLRADFKVDPAKKVAVSIVGKNLAKIKFDEQKDSIIFLARLDKLEVEKTKPKNSVSHVLEGVGEICLHLEGLVDLKKEKERIESEIKSVEGYIKSLEQKLKNKDFAKKAPKEVVEKEEFKLKEQKEKMEKLEEQLKSLR
ncbi:MAG: valine--tRNA ligase [Patescibacteria group bacterium]|nr:valine--tRNA ligase [Patescibacteria group bacterium]